VQRAIGAAAKTRTAGRVDVEAPTGDGEIGRPSMGGSGLCRKS